MAAEETPEVHETNATGPEPERKGEDPILRTDGAGGGDAPPEDTPGTEGGVLAELENRTRYQGYMVTSQIREANRMKNSGIRAALPPWTLVDLEIGSPVLRLVHFEVGTIKALQSREAEDVRRGLQWPRGKDLPTWGKIEVNCRTMLHALVECTDGSAVDIDGAVRANQLRNSGICYAFPSGLFTGVRLRLLHLHHPWIQVVRDDAETYLREALGLREGADLPVEAQTEIERYAMLASILGCDEGVVRCAKPNGSLYDVDLSEMSAEVLRVWVEKELMPKADLRGKVPVNRDDQVEYFQIMFAHHNPDVITAFRRAHHTIRTVENAELLTYGEGYVAGADWDRSPFDESITPYEPTAKPVDMAAMDKAQLMKLWRDNLVPKPDLRIRPPKVGEPRQKHFLDTYYNFNNGALNELLEREAEIREVPAETLLGKGDDYVAGLAESSDSTP